MQEHTKRIGNHCCFSWGKDIVEKVGNFTMILEEAYQESELEDAADRQEEEHLDDLASYVMLCFDRAKRHRDDIGVTETLMDCLNRYRGKYNSEELQKFQGISIYRGMTGMLVRSAYSWLKDAYFNAQDKPWTLDPTPLPELPDELKRELEESIELQIRASLDSGRALQGEIPEERRSMIKELRNTASQIAFDYASESAKGMSKVIEDQFIEADFAGVLEQYLLDILIFPYAVLKGPVVRRKDVPVWEKNRYKFKTEARYYTDRVDPFNLYPSPDSTNTQDGEFVIELIPMSRARLNEAKGLKDFDEDAINLVIEEADHTYNRQAQLRVDDNERTYADGVGRTSNKTDGSMFDVYEYNGRIPGEYLLEFLEMENESDEARENFETVETDWGVIDPYEDYESTIWVCNDIVIMARLNKSQPVPYRGYYVSSCFKVPGSIYGESIPMVVADLQDELNIAARARMFNTGMSSGPIVEADQSRFADNDIPEQIKPWTVYPVTTNTAQNNNSAPALRFTNIPNNSDSYTKIMEEAWEKAHRISGIPPYMYGDGQGAAPTLGAFSLQYAGATKGIKTIISNIDNDIIEKLVQQYYYYNMYYHEDESIKADARVNVRGSAGLIAQEQRQARPLELLQALGPILAQMQPESALALANETLKESGYDPKSLGQNAAQSEASARGLGSSGGDAQSGPSPDGRSGSAQNILSQQQLPGGPVGPSQ